VAWCRHSGGSGLVSVPDRGGPATERRARTPLADATTVSGAAGTGLASRAVAQARNISKVERRPAT